MGKVPTWRIVLFLVLAIGGCAVDLVTKNWIFAKLGLPGEGRWVLVPGIFSFETSLNEGALFGMGQGMALVFAALAVVAAAGIFYWFARGGAGHDTWLTVALGAVTAGIFGNLYDRLGLHGLKWPAGGERGGQAIHAVRDWIYFQIEAIGFKWPLFNIADSLLVVGAIMLFWHAVWREGRQARAAAQPSGKPQTT